MNTDNFPLIFMNSWILESVTKALSKNQHYIGPLIKKKIVNANKVQKSSILKIQKFLKVTDDNSITAVLSDSTHNIFAIFSYNPSIQNFENKYFQRITFHTTNCLILIKMADLEFVLKNSFEKNYNKAFDHDVDITILKILDFEIFQRDQVFLNDSIQTNLKFIYDDKLYMDMCNAPVRHNIKPSVSN